MRTASGWIDYKILGTGGGYKLERWGGIVLMRPDPQVIWGSEKGLEEHKDLAAKYIRDSSGGGKWEYLKPVPDEWTVSYRDYRLTVKPMGFKHTGVFPEQAVNWDIMSGLVAGGGRPVSALNLFAYTGGASIALAKAGASVCHVDASKGMCERAGKNAELSNAENIRYIVDDCVKFVTREIKRGKKYDAVVMDPPSYGRGAGGEVWKLEECLVPLMELCAGILSDNPLFFLVNSYTTGLQASVLSNLLKLTLKRYKGEAEAYEVVLPADGGLVLPCGCSGMFIFR